MLLAVEEVSPAFTIGTLLLGALVGGLASLGGSVLVARGEVARGARITLVMDLLPLVPLKEMRSGAWSPSWGGEHPPSVGPSLPVLIEQIRRSTVISGRRDQRDVVPLLAAFDAYREAGTDKANPPLDLDKAELDAWVRERTERQQSERTAAREALNAAAEVFSHKIEKRIR